MNEAKVFKNISKLINSANISATNKAATSARAKMSKSIREDFNIPAKVIKKNISILKAKQGDNTAYLVISNKPLGLIVFGASQTNKGVTAEIKRGNRQLYKGTFIATMRSGHKGVFKRMDKSKLPIRELYGIRIKQLVTSKKGKKVMENSYLEQYEKAFHHELKRRQG